MRTRPCTTLAVIASLLAWSCVPSPAGVHMASMSDGTKIAYERLGTRGEVIVAPMRVYLRSALLPLSDDYQLVLFDPRGRGASDRGSLDSVSLDRIVRDVEELRAALSIERMTLLGWSGLAKEMAAYAIRYPSRVTRLIQVAPVPPARDIPRASDDPPRVVRIDTAALNTLYAQFDSKKFPGTPQEFCRENQRLALPGQFAIATNVSAVPDVCMHENEWPVNLWPFFGKLVPSVSAFDARAELGALAIPRLVINGREDGIQPSAARAWVAGYSNSRMLELSPSGHFPFIEQREPFFTAVRVFMRGDWPSGAIEVSAPAR